METPGSLSNADEAAILIQRAYRRVQRRIAKDNEELSAILNALEDREENRINERRRGVMATVNQALGSLARTTRIKLKDISADIGLRARSAKDPSEIAALPTLTSGSIENLLRGLGEDERVSMTDALAILQAVAVLFASEPSVIDVAVPAGGKVVVVGDLHGQIHDLLHVFASQGLPSEKTIYVFNGDLVDRGDHACEVCLLIFALKLARPNSVYVNRGNHEEPHINIYGGFEEECLGKYDHSVFQTFHAVFTWLPWACVINGKTLVLHGGLPGDPTVRLRDIRELARGPDVLAADHNMGDEKWMKDLMWSDPHPSPGFRGFEPSARGAGVLWGRDATNAFLDREKLTTLVRSHQCVDEGCEVTHGGRVYTVFSASNYCGAGGNKGAVVIFKEKAERPTKHVKWDHRKIKHNALTQTVQTRREGKAAKLAAAVAQASEYIYENKTALLRYYALGDDADDGFATFEWWATGLSEVLQVRMKWLNLLYDLTTPDEIDPERGGVLYRKWLSRFHVHMKGGCKEWQSDVASELVGAIMQGGGDLAAAFESMDVNHDGELSPEEFRASVRARLPSLAVFSDAQLDAVLTSFDVDGSGEVDRGEFVKSLAASIEPAREGRRRARVGLQWDTSGGEEVPITPTSNDPQDVVRLLADAIARLFFTHRAELFHVWRTHFDVDGTGSISSSAFAESVRVADAAACAHGGGKLISEKAIERLIEVLDSNGDGMIDFVEFSRNVGSLVKRALGALEHSPEVAPVAY
ncbi:calcineurin-like phosphoesterase [Micromonas pusilla CCMP1545]|jgi:diadenosine tetraphosphatase ApaH/serine/threonine PP2A family protein phosphatase/Ca2+-binding EF-hand superfamily protein|uniref:Serine/threonine-protein phosphatase n=1 Tax=Micromonas pusilla (strain CCMP1545) TaxID=564608 RepID=C1MQF7_MICPC|nr:calcineurin-like phosphoesterase [Micromonas pusilla CCMP1545]EEH57700.1 calcineurin-like phosphoesterase [Micromonas pusilla CCMP1545]|eukprot:XP_003057749.1 calcineurin-like phosphoesterase [Micromonas pusilla CCMP1545]